MNRLTRALLFLLLTPAFFACQKEISDETANGGAAKGKLRMKIDGKQWEADSYAGATILAGYIVITGISSDKKNFMIQLEDEGATTYQLDQQSAHVAALSDDNDVNPEAFATNQGQSAADAGGSVVVTKIDATKKTISGTFTLKVYRDLDSKQIVLTEGVFENIPYETQLPPNNGPNADFKVKIDGTSWTGKTVNGAMVQGNLMITASELDLSKTVGLYMPAGITAGTYSFQQLGPVLGVYITGTTNLGSQSGTLKITEHNTTTKIIKGTFDFKAVDILGGAASAQMTEGAFTVQYQ
ncbi:DUF6252 family protein [Paraflavitalea sp. CAU 1676]|uniref:DUF6252 family protein n=1 Tax=Paraflavitalea sp. CAU 1676 TaxID=3032598 RepID=UPI0023DC5E46|nr:DUF6252 family protein [Paraflavitalea sp. CAU 1676]MDF2190835.1 DUF6252 family protein [Paraflavitalea sp. CAU 1676]